MKNYICIQCGTQFRESENPPEKCPICEDERQFVNWEGQKWTELEELQKTHHNIIEKEENGLVGIITKPAFAIGQRALLIPSSKGNILWDCITLINEQTINEINKLGGIAAIVISHPHYYSCMIEWSRAFGGVPIYIHSSDRQWVMRDDPVINYWDGETKELWDEITLINCGGHFSGGTVLHWQSGAQGKGALLTGDIIQVVMDRKHVSFMRSYPNLIPLPEEKVNQIVNRAAKFQFEHIYGAWWNRNILKDGKNALLRSAERYIKAIK